MSCSGTEQAPVVVIVGSMVANAVSGGDVFVLNMAKEWSSRGRRVTVLVTPEVHSVMEDLDGPAIETVRTPSFGQSHLSIAVSYVARSIGLVLRAARIIGGSITSPVVVSASPYPPDVVPAVLATLLGARWVHFWGLVVPEPWKGYRDVHKGQTRLRFPRFGPTLSFLSEKWSLWLFRRMGTLLIVLSETMRDAAVARGVEPYRVHVSPFGVSRSMIMGWPASVEKMYDAVFLGRFHEQKGLTDLATIWEEVVRQRPGSRLAIIGGGVKKIEAEVHKAMSCLPGGSVVFLGALTGRDKYAALREARLFLFPSHYESWGHVVLEALSSGLPVVGYDIPSSREAFGDAVNYVPLGNIEAFAQATLALLRDEPRHEIEPVRMTGQEVALDREWGDLATILLNRVDELE